jgi:hypothetical protein
MRLRILAYGLVTGLLAATLAAGGFLTYVAWYTRGDRIIPGVHVGGVPVGGLTPQEAYPLVANRSPRLAVAGAGPGPCPACGRGLEHLTLRHGDRRWLIRRSDYQTRPDAAGLLADAARLGRDGSVLSRARAFAGSLLRGHFIAGEESLAEEALAAHLEAIAREVARHPADARWDPDRDEVITEREGEELDRFATLQRARLGLVTGADEVELVVRHLPPRVRAADLQRVRQHLVARFTTEILQADAGRVHNITAAIRKINGQVIGPGEIFSFNGVVGPRDQEHGWAPAKEIFNGEFVIGWGGGICQVSSTLYNAVLLGGLTVVERAHHSRPLAYISPGRDATVAWRSVDFKFRNNLESPVLLTGRMVPPVRSGGPRRIEISLYAAQPRPVEVRLETGDERFYPPEHVEVPDPTLLPGERLVIDEGYSGIDVKTYRVLYNPRGETVRELVSHDRYLPKPGRVLVGTGRGATAPPPNQTFSR